MSKSILTEGVIFLVLFVIWTVSLQGLSCSLVGGKKRYYWNVLKATYGESCLETGPNLSLQWYFRMQLFARFRDYFGTIFPAIPFVLVGPISIRFWRYPEVQVRQKHRFCIDF
jgi:hypothetical protein